MVRNRKEWVFLGCNSGSPNKEQAVADQGEGPPLFLDQTKARRGKKICLETAPSPLSQGLNDPPPPPPPPYLTVWICHCKLH